MRTWINFVASLLVLVLPYNSAYAYDRELNVDLALVLVVDVSQSIDENELKLEREGLANAFANREVISAIKEGALGRIAVAVVDFSSTADTLIGWTVISDKESALAFAALLLTKERGVNASNTSIAAGITKAVDLINATPYQATRKVIDVSGDGADDGFGYIDGGRISMETAHEKAAEAHVTINGLPIISEEPNLAQYYQKSVIAGKGSFLIIAESVFDFAQAIRRKLVLEIATLAPRTRGAVF